ncbi:Ser/Thr protein kinase RdoA (MazF antagonist) [Friedmanniella endophytica]|uniref:Ser/Thr protein kinase RdoA (MazF antagonist) n=1 Tax=Microlunatus kandeliicorticis TaxID=1759536 RepID=A0A7W3IRQ7_9ACTN|nr:phosphotransferase [Microlunatus kandeliicorticis]MBA8794048.1 Ser/Thr protein kinase RdoA (MazF antagonist) [Microlunatus kandeliicorticis]
MREKPAEGDLDIQLLQSCLVDQYGLQPTLIRRFSADHPTFLVESDAGAYVARIGQGDLERQAGVLEALANAGFPAAKLLRARNGAPVTKHRTGSRQDELLVMDYIEGRALSRDPEDLYQFGSSLGQLHHHGHGIAAAMPRTIDGAPVVERAGMLPANELRFALRNLLPYEHDLPNRNTARQWKSLVDACADGLEEQTGLTQTFLHGDAHQWNCVRAESGQVHFFDWDSSGFGPAIIDLAFALLSCATGGLIYQPDHAESASIDALLAGYSEHMILAGADRDGLERAIAFRVLVCAGVGFGHFLAAGKDPMQEPTIQWSLERLRTVRALAETAKRSLRYC